jgi:aubergine-like protein
LNYKYHYSNIFSGGNYFKKNDFNFKRDLDSLTKLNCKSKYDKLVDLIDTINHNSEAKSDLEKWNMGFNKDVINFETRVIAQNKIFFGNSQINKAESNGWNFELQRARHISTIRLEHWVIFYMPREHDICLTVQQELIEISRPMGFLIDNPKLVRLPESRGRPTDLFAQALKQELERNRKIQIVICITPNDAKDTYDVIKRICCIEYGVPSQVIISSKLKKNVKSIMTKVAIQMCCKLGGEIWGLSIPVCILNLLINDFQKYPF